MCVWRVPLPLWRRNSFFLSCHSEAARPRNLEIPPYHPVIPRPKRPRNLDKTAVRMKPCAGWSRSLAGARDDKGKARGMTKAQSGSTELHILIIIFTFVPYYIGERILSAVADLAKTAARQAPQAPYCLENKRHTGCTPYLRGVRSGHCHGVVRHRALFEKKLKSTGGAPSKNKKNDEKIIFFNENSAPRNVCAFCSGIVRQER